MAEFHYGRKTVEIARHAVERFVQRKIPFDIVVKMLERGVKIMDSEPGKMLCIYKSCGEFYTIVYAEDEESIRIITGYHSNEWEIRQFGRAKAHERQTKKR